MGKLEGALGLDFKEPKHEFIFGNGPAAIGIDFLEAALQSFIIYNDVERREKLGKLIGFKGATSVLVIDVEICKGKIYQILISFCDVLDDLLRTFHAYNLYLPFNF